MSTAAVHPSSSPRLPSPPPLTEVQISPQSPSVGDSFGKDAEQFLGYTQDDNDDVNSTRRVRPGTKALDMAGGPPLVPLAQLDSPFQLQEHLKALHNHFTRPENSDTVAPIHRDVAIQLAEPPEGVDRALWLYELCRFLTMKVNNLIVAFFSENPPCSAQTCPEMQASEWQYLCAVHDPPKTCCAIDDCCHTLDWATNILTSPKYFPSRLTLGSEASGGPQASMRHLVNIFRRLYRIFAHAWFKHREVFWQVESNEGLYVFFKTVCDVYHLIPEDNYTVPPEAEGIDPQPPAEVPAEVPRLTLLKKEDETPSDAGATTRRHKHTPSTGSRVTTIAESAEDSEPLPEVEEDDAAVADAAAAEKTESTTAPEPEPAETVTSEETATAGESQSQESENQEVQEPTEQPSNGDITDVQQEDTQEPEPEEPVKEESEEVTQPQSTEEVETKEEESRPEEVKPEPEPEASRAEETKTETEESKPEGEGEVVSSEVTTDSSEPAPEQASEPATESESKPESKPEAETETKAEAKQPEPDSEPKSETEPAKEA